MIHSRLKVRHPVPRVGLWWLAAICGAFIGTLYSVWMSSGWPLRLFVRATIWRDEKWLDAEAFDFLFLLLIVAPGPALIPVLAFLFWGTRHCPSDRALILRWFVACAIAGVVAMMSRVLIDLVTRHVIFDASGGMWQFAGLWRPALIGMMVMVALGASMFALYRIFWVKVVAQNGESCWRCGYLVKLAASENCSECGISLDRVPGRSVMCWLAERLDSHRRLSASMAAVTVAVLTVGIIWQQRPYHQFQTLIIPLAEQPIMQNVRDRTAIYAPVRFDGRWYVVQFQRESLFRQPAVSFEL